MIKIIRELFIAFLYIVAAVTIVSIAYEQGQQKTEETEYKTARDDFEEYYEKRLAEINPEMAECAWGDLALETYFDAIKAEYLIYVQTFGETEETE